jgi:hypothetical protein
MFHEDINLPDYDQKLRREVHPDKADIFKIVIACILTPFQNYAMPASFSAFHVPSVQSKTEDECLSKKYQ